MQKNTLYADFLAYLNESRTMQFGKLKYQATMVLDTILAITCKAGNPNVPIQKACDMSKQLSYKNS